MGENALEKAKVALTIIDHLAKQEWSPTQECMLRAAYTILTWQYSPLGVGIEPLWDVFRNQKMSQKIVTYLRSFL